MRPFPSVSREARFWGSGEDFSAFARNACVTVFPRKSRVFRGMAAQNALRDRRSESCPKRELHASCAAAVQKSNKCSLARERERERERERLSSAITAMSTVALERDEKLGLGTFRACVKRRLLAEL